MQVAPLTTSAAPASPAPAEDTGSRAEQFARMLQSAFFGSGAKAVTRGAEPAAPETAARNDQRGDMRSPEPRGNDKRISESREPQAADRNTRPDAATQNKPAEKTAQTPADKPAEKPADTSSDPADGTDAQVTNENTAADGEATEAAAAPEQAATAETDGEVVADATPVAANMTTSDLLLILSLLQDDAASPEAAQAAAQNQAAAIVPGEAGVPVAAGQVPAPTPAVAPVAAQPASAIPVVADAQAAPVVPAVPAAAAPVLPAGAAQPVVAAEAAAAMAKATETSAAALLMQQQDVSPEDFAAIQQALAAQSQQPKPVAPPAAKPAMPEMKPANDGVFVVEVQQAAPQAAPKVVVDQSALLAMQGEQPSAQEAGLALVQTPPQPQAPAQQQPASAEAKFAAALQQVQAEAAPQAAAANAAPHAPAHLNQQAGSAASVSQASQQAATQTAARNLNAYLPAGEQVAVQIKRGVGEGLDKISIRLDPGNLGKVDVKMEVGHDGKLMAIIAADKPETLAMLQRDAQNLEQSLRDAGLKTSSDSLNFTLRDQNQTAEGREGRDGQGNGNGRQRGRGHDEYAGTGQATDPAALAAANAQRAASARGGLDIRI